MPRAQKKQGQRNPNLLPREDQAKFLKLLQELMDRHDNGAEVGRMLGISGSAVSQLLKGKNTVSIDTAARIARENGVRLYVGISGERPPEGMRTIGSDQSSASALIAAAREYDLPHWVVSVLARTPIPEHWPSLTPPAIVALADVWCAWEGRLGSKVRLKTEKS